MKSRISVLLVAFAMLFAAAIPETATGKSPKVRNGMIEFPEPARAKGQTDVLQLRCDPIPVVRVALSDSGCAARWPWNVIPTWTGCGS